MRVPLPADVELAVYAQELINQIDSTLVTMEKALCAFRASEDLLTVAEEQHHPTEPEQKKVDEPDQEPAQKRPKTRSRTVAAATVVALPAIIAAATWFHCPLDFDIVLEEAKALITSAVHLMM